MGGDETIRRQMNRFWDPVLRKLVEAVQARRLVEIGVAEGLLTSKVLEYCAEVDAVLHAVDPAPQINVDEWQKRHGDRLVFHRARSLDVLGNIHDVDVAFIDGDHNWFTVYHELKLLEETAQSNGATPPLIALHDVDWPYGRRDMYYDPESIPPAHRHDHRLLGLVPGEDKPIDGGVNGDFNNAITESSPRNGVRTAIEDFASHSRLDWKLSYLPGFHGLGIAVTADHLASNDPLRAAIESVQTARFLDEWARAIELARVEASLQSGQLQKLLGHAERCLADARREAENAREEARLLDHRVTMAAELLADVFNSPSWRLTQPLRTAKHAAARLRSSDR